MSALRPPRRITFLLFTALFLLALTGLLWSGLSTSPSKRGDAKSNASRLTDRALNGTTSNIGSTSTTSDEAHKARLGEAYGRMPLSFEENAGQTNKEVKFLARVQDYQLYLTPTEAVISLDRDSATEAEGREQTNKDASMNVALRRKHTLASKGWRFPSPSVLRMSLVGANKNPSITGDEEQAGKSNYFIGRAPKKWRTDVSHFSRVRYEAIYPGVDLEYYGNQGQLEYDFRVALGASTEQIRLGFKGAQSIRVDEATGDLVLEMASGELRQHKPFVYQESEGGRREVEARYRLLDAVEAGRATQGSHVVGFDVAEYDRSRPLVIDPTLTYSSYMGGANAEDKFPTIAGPIGPNGETLAAYVAKLNAIAVRRFSIQLTPAAAAPTRPTPSRSIPPTPTL